MTIARDPKTGAVLGQVTAETVRRFTTALDEYQTDSYVLLQLLTRDGRYVTLPAHAVRLEELR